MTDKEPLPGRRRYDRVIHQCLRTETRLPPMTDYSPGNVSVLTAQWCISWGSQVGREPPRLLQSLPPVEDVPRFIKEALLLHGQVMVKDAAPRAGIRLGTALYQTDTLLECRQAVP